MQPTLVTLHRWHGLQACVRAAEARAHFGTSQVLLRDLIETDPPCSCRVHAVLLYPPNEMREGLMEARLTCGHLCGTFEVTGGGETDPRHPVDGAAAAANHAHPVGRSDQIQQIRGTDLSALRSVLEPVAGSCQEASRHAAVVAFVRSRAHTAILDAGPDTVPLGSRRPTSLRSAGEFSMLRRSFHAVSELGVDRPQQLAEPHWHLGGALFKEAKLVLRCALRRTSRGAVRVSTQSREVPDLLELDDVGRALVDLVVSGLGPQRC